MNQASNEQHIDKGTHSITLRRIAYLAVDDNWAILGLVHAENG